eukprot:scaffold8119_cov444-Prasinococcus_capsulatus_cf.AAC.10
MGSHREVPGSDCRPQVDAPRYCGRRRSAKQRTSVLSAPARCPRETASFRSPHRCHRALPDGRQQRAAAVRPASTA